MHVKRSIYYRRAAHDTPQVRVLRYNYVVFRIPIIYIYIYIYDYDILTSKRLPLTSVLMTTLSHSRQYLRSVKALYPERHAPNGA